MFKNIHEYLYSYTYVFNIYIGTSYALLNFKAFYVSCLIGKLLTHVRYLHEYFLNICSRMGGILNNCFKSVFGGRIKMRRINLVFSSCFVTAH